MILDKLKRLVRRAYSASEDSYKYDGLFSYKSETHAFTWGLGFGLALVLAYQFMPGLVEPVGSSLAALLAYAYSDRRQKAKGAQVPDYVWKQSSQEPHYLAGGVVLGLLLGAIVVFGLPVLAVVA